MLAAISGTIFVLNVGVGGLSLWLIGLFRTWKTDSKSKMVASAKQWTRRLSMGGLVRLAHLAFLAAGFLIEAVVSRPLGWAIDQAPLGLALDGFILFSAIALSVVWIIGMLPTVLWDPPDGFALVGLLLPTLAALIQGPFGAWINGDVLNPLAAWAEAAIRAKFGL